MRMMGADSVAYHRETIIERGDDFPGAALEYYASRGETPLLWGGSGAESLGLVGPVDNPSYDAVYGSGGARHPVTGEQLVHARTPGMDQLLAGDGVTRTAGSVDGVVGGVVDRTDQTEGLGT